MGQVELRTLLTGEVTAQPLWKTDGRFLIRLHSPLPYDLTNSLPGTDATQVHTHVSPKDI